MERTAIIMLKLSGGTVRTDIYVSILRTMAEMMLKELNKKAEVLVWTHKIVKSCYYAQIKSSDERYYQ